MQIMKLNCKVYVATVAMMVAFYGTDVPRCQASVITTFSLSSSTNGNYSSISSATFGNPPGVNEFTHSLDVLGATQPAAVNISGTATLLNSLANWTVTLANFGGAFDYFFTVDILNSNAGSIGPVKFNLTAGSLAVGAGGIAFNTTPTPTSNYNSYNNFNPGATTDTQLFFGGLNGGGGEFYNTQTGTFTFSLHIPSGVSGTFGFSLTAMPEPTSLVLGSIGMVALGGIGYRRRKKQLSTATEQTNA